MRRIRLLVLIGILLVCQLFPWAGQAEGTWYGSVVCESSRTVLAPFGGRVSQIAVRPGNRVLEGDMICVIETTKVYATADGTVAAVYAQPGDSLETVKDLYTAALFITPTERFTIKADTKKADKNADCYVLPGQTVYLESGKGKTLKTGAGYVFSVASGSSESDTPGDYKVRITSGSFYLDEKVTIFRTEARGKNESLGQGTVEQTSQMEINGEGSVLRMHVKAGDEVKRGDLLLETVSGSLEGLIVPDNRIVSAVDGIVSACELTDGSTVEKGATLMTVYPLDQLQVAITVPESELKNLAVGKAVKVTFSHGGEPVDGTVASISYLAASGENAGTGYASYKVYIDFNADDAVRLGMLATVEIP